METVALRGNVAPDSTAQKLEQYILTPDPFQADLIPKRLAYAAVAEFITSRIGPNTSLKSLVRVERVVTFYDLQEVCGHLSSLLPRNPLSGDVPKAAVIARTIAATCPPPDREKIAGYAVGLAGLAATSADVAELVELEDRLSGQSNPKPLAARIAELRAAVEPKRQTDNQARLEAARLDELRTLRLGRVNAANGIKARTLEIVDRQKRVQEEVKMYLTVEYGYLEYLTPFAAWRLRRETWGENPPDQSIRQEIPERRSELAQVFLNLSSGIDKLPDVAPDNYDSLRVRCLRAAEFFGAQLDPKTITWVKEHAGRQVDILSND